MLSRKRYCKHVIRFISPMVHALCESAFNIEQTKIVLRCCAPGAAATPLLREYAGGRRVAFRIVKQ